MILFISKFFFDIPFNKGYNKDMTILEASGYLYKWFQENDSFSIDKDFKKIIMITEEPNRDRVAFELALNQLDEMGMIKGEFSGQDHLKYWVLNKSFLSYEQNLSISPDLALTISDIINKFCENTNNTKDLCDPANLEQKDIENLIYICNILISDKKDLDSETEI